MGRREAKSTPVSNGQFDFLKRAAELGLPALGALHIALSTAWGWPYQDQITGTIVGINVFVGVLVVIFRGKYDSGEVDGGTFETVQREDGSTGYVFDLAEEPEVLAQAGEKVVFTVKKGSA